PKVRKTKQKEIPRSYFKEYFDSKILNLSQQVVKRALKDECNNSTNINFIYSTIPSVLFNNEGFELFQSIHLLLDNGIKHNSKSADDKSLRKAQKARIKDYEEFVKTGKRSPDHSYDKPAHKPNHNRIPMP